jgi:hypothetical protein
MYIRTFIFNILCISGVVFAGGEEKIEKLIPPNLRGNVTLKEVVCMRPRRDGLCNISYQSYEDSFQAKKIIHCYGHGGWGWSTLFGSIKKVGELLRENSIDKNTPIHIIGAGCMGLGTAVELAQQGYTMAGISAKELYNLPSWHAAGYFDYPCFNMPEAKQQEIEELGLETFATCQRIEKGEHPYFSPHCVKFLPIYSPRSLNTMERVLAQKGLIPPQEEVTLDLGNGVIHKEFVKSYNYIINTAAIMNILHEELAKKSIPLMQKEIKSFKEISEPFIINCSGLGAAELAQDSALIPTRGHLLLLNKNAGLEHMNYMIFNRVIQEDTKEYLYMFPKQWHVDEHNTRGQLCYGALGGTFIPNTHLLSAEEQKALDEKEFKKIRDRHSMFFYGHSFQEDEKH